MLEHIIKSSSGHEIDRVQTVGKNSVAVMMGQLCINCQSKLDGNKECQKYNVRLEHPKKTCCTYGFRRRK